MSAIKLKNIQQTIVGSTTQPLKIGGVAADGSDAVITINNGVATGLKTTYNTTVPYTSWTGASAPFSKEITINGILSTDEPLIDIVPTGTYETDTIIRDNWALVYRAVTSTNTLTFYADSVPSADIPIKLLVIR